MRRLIYFLSCLIAFLFMTTGQASAQTVLLSEDFNDCALPTGWSVDIDGNQDALYGFGDITNDNNDGSTIDGSCMFWVDDDGTGENTPAFSLQLSSPSFDASGYETVRIEADVHFRNAYGEERFRILIWDGDAWRVMRTFQGGDDQTGEQFSEYLRVDQEVSFFATADMRVAFAYDDGSGVWGWWAGVDNVRVTGEGETDAVNLVRDHFDDCGLPNGWVSQVITGNGDWQIGTIINDNASSNSMNGTCFAYFDDDGLGEDAPPSRARLISPVFSGAEYSNIVLEYDVILRRFEDNENLQVAVYDVETGEVFPVATYLADLGGPQFNEYINEVLDLSTFRLPQMRLVFQYDDGGGWGWWVGLDNIRVTGQGSINDDCSRAEALLLGQTFTPGDNTIALMSGPNPSCAIGNVGGLWYQFLPTANGLHRVVNDSKINDVITIFSGSCGDLVEVACTNRDEHGFTGETLYWTTEANTPYYIRVNGQRGGFGQERGEFCLAVEKVDAAPTGPANDFCADALTLEIDGDCVTATNQHANLDGPFPSRVELARSDIWFQFTAENDDALLLESSADFADVLTLYSGDCSGLTEIVSNEYGRELVLEGLVAGTTYFLQLSGVFATVEGSCCVSLAPYDLPTPDNVSCIDAISLPLDGACVASSNVGASFSGPNPSCAVYASASVWYEFVAPASGTVQLNTGADFPHVSSLYFGDCGELQERWCSSGALSCDGFQIIGELAPGEVYYLRISSVADEFGFAPRGELCVQLSDGADMAPFEPLILTAEVTCIQEGLGELTVSASGGRGLYTFEGTPHGTLLATGDPYIVIVRDEAGCERSISNQAQCGQQDCALAVNVMVSDISCAGANNGSLNATASNGAGTLTYEWNTGSSNAQINSLAPGAYTVTVTDENLCRSETTITLDEPAELLSDITATDESSFAANDGSLNATISGGTAPYTYNWSNGATGASLSGVTPGDYTLTVTDQNQCATTISATVEAFACAIQLDIMATAPNCADSNDGQLVATVNSGNGNITYQWSTDDDGASLDNLAAGTYALTVSDENNCPASETITLTAPSPISLAVSASGESAVGANDGSISTTVDGGTGPYSYLWSNDATGANIMDVAPGTYTVTITDANGCTSTQTTTVNAFACAINMTVNTTNLSCDGANDGSASLSVLGAADPYLVEWSTGGQNVLALSSLSAGDYALTLTDDNGCVSTQSFTISAPDELNATALAQSNPACAGEATGSIEVVLDGGTAPYAINWTGVASGDGLSQNNLPVGTATLGVIDANGCILTQDYAISVDDQIAPLVVAQPITLDIDEDGMVVLTAQQLDGGSSDNCGGLSLSVDQNVFDCGQLGEQTVTLTATDANGNSSSTTTTVMVRDQIAPVVTCVENILSNDCSGLVEYTPPTATDNCGNVTVERITGLGSGAEFPIGTTMETYRFTDASGNVSECSFTITIANTLDATVTIDKPNCAGGEDAQAVLSVTGGTAGYSYLWNDENSTTTENLTNVGAGTYFVTVTDAANCTYTSEVVIPPTAELLVTIDSVMNADPDGSGGSIEITSAGGTPPYTYTWTESGTLASTSEDPNDLPPGNYTLELVDANGCILLVEDVVITLISSRSDPGLLSYWQLNPNPTREQAWLSYQFPQANQLQIEVFSPNGQLIRRWMDLDARMGQVELSTQDLPGGVYSVRLTVDEATSSRRLVVVK